MRFVFWQNVVSIHQSAFIKALAGNNEVVLVAAEELDSERRNEKWTVPSMGNARVIIAPDDSKIKKLLDEPETNHVFSGINGYPMVYRAFKMAMKRGLKVSVMAEPYEWAGLKGWLRRQMYRWLFIRYGKNISHLFATGNMGVECYIKSGFPKEKIYQWGYFTELLHGGSLKSVSTNSKVKLLYVGRLDENKNILPLLRQINEYGDGIECFTIVGDGILLDKVRSLAHSNNKIIVKGRLDNDSARQIMSNHDYLILPSLYDGWGAVVNEALSVGTRVLCSDACGASILLDGKWRGESFKQTQAIETIRKWAEKGPLSQQERDRTLSWANTHISGKVAAQYFLEVINNESPTAPWLL